MAATLRKAGRSLASEDGASIIEATTRDRLHQVVDMLPPGDLTAVANALDEAIACSDLGDSDLIARWIRPHPHKSGPEDVVVDESFVPVYALIGYLPIVNGDHRQVAEAYEVPLAAMEAAVAYYQRHRAIIDARIYSGEPKTAASIEQ